MGLWFSRNIFPFYCELYVLTRVSEATTYSAYHSRGDATCKGAGPNDKCIFYCDEKEGKESQPYQFNCGMVANCEIRCEQKKCFADGTIDAGFVSNDLTIIASGESDQCMKLTEINAPNYGSVHLSQSHKAFRNTIVNAGTNTENIIIDCTSGMGDDCKGLSVNAQTAQYLEIKVGRWSELYGDTAAAQIHCPVNSNYNGAPCVLDLSGGGLLYWVDIHAKNGIPSDVTIKTGSVIMAEVRIICDAGKSWNSGNSFPSTSPCWLVPTPQPTTRPTPKPTPKPTTSKPTAIPTKRPTRTPSAPPTLKPTNAPIIGTKAPTRPTGTPTKKPTKGPTKRPTDHPTTSTPSNHPATDPTATSAPSAAGDTCFTSCASDPYAPMKCKAHNIGIKCHDTNNECHARCVIGREMAEAETRYANDPNAVYVYTQLTGTTTDEAFVAYCSSGFCSDTSTTSTTTTTTATTMYTTHEEEDPLTVKRHGRVNGDGGLDTAGIVAVVLGALLLFVCCFFCCLQLWKRYQRKLIEPGGADEEMLKSLDEEILSGHYELKGNKLVELKGAGTRWDQYDIAEDKEMENTDTYGLQAPPPRMRTNRDDEEEEDGDDTTETKAHNVVSLQTLGIASCVATPCGCLLCWCSVQIIMTLFAVYMVLFPICLSFNFSDFKVINSEISNEQYQFVLAQETAYDMLGESISLSRRRNRRLLSSGSQRQLLYEKHGRTLYTKQDYLYRAIAADSLTVFYYSKTTNNILTNELLEMVHLIEKGIKSYDGYANHSLIWDVDSQTIKTLFGYGHRQLFLEARPGSFLNFLYPSNILGIQLPDGNGDTLSLINGDLKETVRSLLIDPELKDIDVTDFFDFSFNSNGSSKYLAAVYPFGYDGYHEFEQPLELYNWVASYKPNFFDALPAYISSQIGVAVVDTRLVILNDELYYYLSQDFKLAIASLVIIYVVLYLYCRSFYITTFGILGVCCSFIPCFAIYQMMWGESFNIVNLVSVWVILGIGCDDICVFISSYRRAPLESVNGEAIPNHLRLAFAYREAGGAMFVTSFTTSFSFFSLCLSTINPLPQFGWFLGSLVLTNFVLVMTWFPVILQSYVWFVMGAIEYNLHIDQCTKWLAVAVPLPSSPSSDDGYPLNQEGGITGLTTGNAKPQQHQLGVPQNKQGAGGQRQSSIWQRESVMSALTQNRLYAHDVDKRYRQQSKLFAVPSAQARPSAFVPLSALQEEEKPDWRRKSVKKIAKKLDKNKKYSGFEAETKFGDCTNLYFILMRRGLGIALIILTIVLTIVFCITATQIQLAQETAVLLPENTNWGRVNTAFKHLNIDPDEYGGYSASSGGSSGSINPNTNGGRPTRSPSAPTTTRSPTAKPTWYPTRSSSSPTVRPTYSPVTPEPTTPWPTWEPTISDYPSETPTKRPTNAIPINPRYKCINDGYNIVCKVEPFRTADPDIETRLQKRQIALVFEGGGLYNEAYNVSWEEDIVACPYYNNQSWYYEEDAYISPDGYDVKWCFLSVSPVPTSTVQFEYKAPYSSLMTTSWYQVSLWLFYNGEWNHIVNKKGEMWYNYSLDVLGFGSKDGANTLSVDESLAINLLFGTRSATELTTNCDGEVISGQLTFDPLFDIYSASAQQRWNELCDALKSINNPVLYRTDADQDLCFAFAFNEYLSNSSNGAYGRMPNSNTLDAVKFNGYLLLFISQQTSASFSDAPLFDARLYRNWFGTETSAAFHLNTSRITWIQQTVRTQIDDKWGGPVMWDYYVAWQKWMDDFNRDSPPSFQGIQTSSTYIRMEVEVAFLNGFIQSVGYTILLCSLVMVFFTQNVYLVLLVCLYILLICIFVVGIFGAFGWPFGIIEVISVPTVVGLTIDYALHITHAYIHSPFPDRSSRSKSAVNDLGSSVFASAMTTISSMFILYFAAIVIFSDLGWVVGSTALFGVSLALLVCPPCLMYTGPEYNQCHVTWFNCCCSRQCKEENGCTIKGYTFCANKWHGMNKHNDPSAAADIDTKKHDTSGDHINNNNTPQKIELRTINKESMSSVNEDDDDLSPIMMSPNPLQYTSKVSPPENNNNIYVNNNNATYHA